MGSNKNKKWGKATIAGLVAAATLASRVVGAFAGAFLASGLGISAGGIVGQIAIAAAGAIVLLVFARPLKRM